VCDLTGASVELFSPTSIRLPSRIRPASAIYGLSALPFAAVRMSHSHSPALLAGMAFLPTRNAKTRYTADEGGPRLCGAMANGLPLIRSGVWTTQLEEGMREMHKLPSTLTLTLTLFQSPIQGLFVSCLGGQSNQ